MRKLTYLLIATLLFSCSVPNRFIVSELGYEPKEYQQSLIYTLPKTTLNVQVDYKRDLFIPGPYADYAGKMLGITGVRKDRDESYAISAVHIDRKTEPDFGACYSVAAVEGDISGDFIAGLQAKGLIWNGSYTGADSYFSEDVSATAVEDVLYKDVTMEPNEEVHTKTIYKTIISDTSFIDVPVTTEQMERKTLETKAQEAARLILEIRSDRYYIAAGLLDPYPDNFDMKTAMKELDLLEEKYLSLFIGRHYSNAFSKTYTVVPSGSLQEEKIGLEIFSAVNGPGDRKGTPIQLIITPGDNAESYRNLMPQTPDTDVYNRVYYRIPDRCSVVAIYENKLLFSEEMEIFQGGALVSEKISE